MCRPLLDDYAKSRGADAVHAMASAALVGDTNGAVIHAARHALFNALMSDIETYYAQETAIHGLPPVW